MHRGLRLSTLTVAGLTTAGLIGFTAPAVAGDSGGPVYKREDGVGSVVTTLDDDDDDDTNDTNTNTGAGTNSHGNGNTGGSRSRADNTNSRVTGVSRDGENSRGDKTKDLTNDGPGKKKRDWSANNTNDGSRNDTRR